MKVNQQTNLPKIQESSENANSTQNTNSSNSPFQADSIEPAKSEYRSLSANESLADEMKKLRNDKEDYQSKFKEFSEKEQQTMEELATLMKILSQMRQVKSGL